MGAAPARPRHSAVVLDHVGRAGDGLQRRVDDPAFKSMLALVAEGQLWAKLTLVRGSRQAPQHEDFRPLHEALVAANPDRLLWGTDWPLILMGDRQTPDLGHLLDLFDAWTPDDARQRILVDNPARLYGFAMTSDIVSGIGPTSILTVEQT